MPCWRLDAWSWLEVFGIYLEGLLYTWRRLLFDVGLVILEAYIWCPSFTMLSLEEFAICWRPWSWCPSFGGSCLWSATLGDDSWLMHLEAWEVFDLVVLEIDDALPWLGRGLMIGDFATRWLGDLTFDLVMSWVGSQEPCLLVLPWSWLWRGWMMWVVRDDDQTDAYVVVVTIFFVLLCKLGLAHSEGWIPQTPLGWIQENTS